jgi:PAS domain S-box-containing protein
MERELRIAEKRFLGLIEKSVDGIALLDSNLTVRYASPATHRILGYSVEEFVGRDIFDLIPTVSTTP